MDDDAILLALGKLQGQMDGIGREIGDLKKLMAQSNQNCINCKTDLCGDETDEDSCVAYWNFTFKEARDDNG